MANEVYYYSSFDAGAPVLNNVAGSLIGVLDACLLNGYNTQTLASLSVTGNVATASKATHGFKAEEGKWIEVSGATPASLNGLKKVTSHTSNTFSFAAPGVADGLATGTITVKRPPIGWSKPFSGTNKAVYRSVDPSSTGRYLRVLDDAAVATEARAVMYETMTDVDTGLGPSPRPTDLAGGVFWGKTENNATAKTWIIIGDSRIFYLFIQVSSSAFITSPYAFGDIKSYRPGDMFSCILYGSDVAVTTGASRPLKLGMTYICGFQPDNWNSTLSRSSSQTAGSVRSHISGLGQNGQVQSSQGQFPNWPSPVDNGMAIATLFVTEENASFLHPIRGELPGALQMLAGVPYGMFDTFSGIANFPGRTCVVITIQAANTQGRMAIDITGPWR